MTPKTLRKERKEKFIEILMKYYVGINDGVLEELLDAAESRSEKINLASADIGWSILANHAVSEDAIAENQAIKATQDAFEQDLNLPATWKWTGGTMAQERAMKKLTEFILPLYLADKDCFTKYHTWRSQPFSRGAVSNTNLLRSPLDFISSWTDFVSQTRYVVRVATTQTDENDVPISY